MDTRADATDFDDQLDLEDPASYPKVDDLRASCDLVMKGGITSGVIYPQAICQLATDHRIHSVGGTSAGAIAAAGAAAAEYGRATGGYATLAGLPRWLSSTAEHSTHTNLYEMFQPQKRTAALYRLASIFIGQPGWAQRALRSIVPGIRVLKPTLLTAVLVALPAFLVLLGALEGSYTAVVASALLFTIGLFVSIVFSAYSQAKIQMKENLFGLCSGMPGHNSTHAALTPWLTEEINSIAGLDRSGPPLTFGMLEERGITLAMLTTNISTGTQYALPLEQRIWAFDPIEFRQLFPSSVVEWMEANPGQRSPDTLSSLAKHGLCPLPAAADLPIIVGVRMSLSFPALLSAVPLHAIDYRVSFQPVVTHWFSDGGITSNFPLHFFDNAVPGHPTFGIDLETVDERYIVDDEAGNVSMPESNGQGIVPAHNLIETVPQFARAVKHAVQNWADNMQTHMPGYRDRIVTVRHTKDEGGLNLDMDSITVERLSLRGRHAGGRAQHQFDRDNHRWIRYRSFLHVLEKFVRPAAATIEASDEWPDRSYRDMVANPEPRPDSWSVASAERMTNEITGLALAFAEEEANRTTVADDGTTSSKTFANGAPKPSPTIQIRPQL